MCTLPASGTLPGPLIGHNSHLTVQGVQEQGGRRLGPCPGPPVPRAGGFHKGPAEDVHYNRCRPAQDVLLC